MGDLKMTDSLTTDLNATIANAVNARIEGQVLAALADSDVMGRMVTAALQKKVNTGAYRNNETTYLQSLIGKAIEEKTAEVVAADLETIRPLIETQVRAALRKSVGVLADSLVEGFVQAAAGSYPSISVTYKR